MTTYADQVSEFVHQYLTLDSETFKEFACYCPYHNNTDSPAFFINKTTGLWYCFNPSCGMKGNFQQLVYRVTGKNAVTKHVITDDELLKALEVKEDIEEEDWLGKLEKILINFNDPKDLAKIQYITDRGFHPTVLRHFEIGYSEIQRRIVIPLRDEDYKVVGFIGRAVDEETKARYKYSDGLPKATVLFNLQNAKHYSDVYITEGSLDAIKVHQAGYPNVISTLGASVAPHQFELINKYFNEVTILSDNDPAGESMKQSIIKNCPRKTIFVVQYPEGKKDPGELAEREIRDLIGGRIDYLSALFAG